MFSKNIITLTFVSLLQSVYGNSTAQLIVNTLHLDNGTNVQKIHSPHSCENCHLKTETDHIIHSTYKLPVFSYFRIKSKLITMVRLDMTWPLSTSPVFTLPMSFSIKKKKMPTAEYPQNPSTQQTMWTISNHLFKVCFYPYAILHEPNLFSEALVFPLATWQIPAHP